MPGSTTLRARRSASIMGREKGGAERIEDTVDLPVAMEPVRPRRSIFGWWLRWEIVRMIWS